MENSAKIMVSKKAHVPINDRLVAKYESLDNILSGMGTSADQGEGMSWGASGTSDLSNDEIEAIYATWMGKRGARIPIVDIAQRGRQITNAPDHYNDAKIMTWYRQAAVYARVYGTSYLIVSAEGVTEEHYLLERPQSRIAENLTLVNLTISDKEGFYKHKQASGREIEIHESWVIKWQNRDDISIGKSIYESNEKDIARAYSALKNLSTMIGKSVIDVFAVEDLFEEKAGCGSGLTGGLIKRMNDISATASNHNMIVRDLNGELFERATFNTDPLMNSAKFLIETVASSFSIPITRFIGSQSKGLNNSGESDMQIYYEYLESLQQDTAELIDLIDHMMGHDFTWSWRSIENSSSKYLVDIAKVGVEAAINLMNSEIPNSTTTAMRLLNDAGIADYSDELINEYADLESID